MPRIHCLYVDCTFLDNTYCSAPTIELDPDLGCATYVPLGEEDILDDDEWEDEDEDEGFENWDTEDEDEDGEDFADEDDW